MELWDGYLVTVVVVLVLAIAHGLHGHRGTVGKWGALRFAFGEEGPGAYRSAPRYAVVTPPAPGSVLLAGVVVRVWAALTLLVFVPAGVVGALLFLGLGEHSVVSGLLAFVLGALVLSGLGLSFALFAATTAVEQRQEGSDARDVVRWSLVHHALVALVFVVEGIAIDPQAAALALFVVVPVCAVGVGITIALRRAAERAAAVVPVAEPEECS